MSERIAAAAVDLDNCIADDSWRWHLFELHLPLPNERYTRYHDACGLDVPDNLHVLAEIKRNRYKVIIFTSRPEAVRIKTEKWLMKWGINYEHLLMRPDDNHEPSTVLKRRMLCEMLPLIAPEYEIQLAIDDRMDILNMYQQEGVRICRRVFINEPEIQHP